MFKYTKSRLDIKIKKYMSYISHIFRISSLNTTLSKIIYLLIISLIMKLKLLVSIINNKMYLLIYVFIQIENIIKCYISIDIFSAKIVFKISLILKPIYSTIM